MKYFLIIIPFLIFSELFASAPNIIKKNNNSIPVVFEPFKPRPGFRKQRFGFNTFFLEATFIYGYYKGQKYSLNYDLITQTSDMTAFTLRVGYEKVKMYEGFDRDQIPLYANLLIGNKNHYELSAGAFYDLTNNKINPTFSTGFRHHNPKGGFFFRVTCFLTMEREIDPVHNLETKRIWVYGPSLGLGWSF